MLQDSSLDTLPKSAVRHAPPHALRWLPLFVISLTAFAVEIPFFFEGTPSGHDVEFHLYSWLDVVAQWKHGILFPRWAAMAHFGYGEPRFIFYPPASWTLGGLISMIVPWTLASDVYLWIALVLAGISMFVLARQWLSRRDTIFAGALYAANPYHLVIVYWRSAFAELLAASLVPLLLLLVLRLPERRWRVLPWLSLLLAAAWLTNAPAAVMIHYSLVLLLIVIAWRSRAWEILWVGAAAVVLGAGLASFYLLPAIYEQRWVEIAQAISAGSRPIDNFLFIHTTDADHDAFNRLISWLALVEIAIMMVAAWAARLWRQKQKQAWDVMAVWTIACAFVLFPVSGFLWRWLPKFEFMQFPWRWLLCLSMVMTIFVAVGLRRWWPRIAVCAIMLLVIAVAWNRIQVPWWDNAGDLREMQDNMESNIGYEGTDEYTPVGTDPSAIDKDARKVTVAGPAHAAIRVLSWNAESKSFTAEMSQPDQLAMKLFAYPAWRVEVNDYVITTSRRPDGQMLVPVEAGMNRVQVTFTRTWDRTAGWWISGVSAIFLCGLFIRRRSNIAPKEADPTAGRVKVG